MQLRASFKAFGELHSHKFGKPDLEDVILSDNFVLYPSDLCGAPRVPPFIMDIFESWSGRGVKELSGNLAGVVRRWLAQV